METVLKEFIEPFLKLSDQEMTELSKFVEVRNYTKGIVVTEIGEKEQYLHFVAGGIVLKYFYHGKEEIVTQIATEGDLIFSTASFFTGQPSLEIVETIAETVFYSINRESIEKLYTISPKFETLSRLILAHVLVAKENREKKYLPLTAEGRFKKFINESADLFMEVPQKYLASYINIQPETFSRFKRRAMRNFNK